MGAGVTKSGTGSPARLQRDPGDEGRALAVPEAAAGTPGSRLWRRRDLTLASVLTDNRGNLAVHRQGA